MLLHLGEEKGRDDPFINRYSTWLVLFSIDFFFLFFSVKAVSPLSLRSPITNYRVFRAVLILSDPPDVLLGIYVIDH